MKINYIHDNVTHNPNAAKEVLPYLFSIIHPATIIDFGCGVGSWLKVAKELGVKKILGVDGLQVDDELLSIDKDEFIIHDFTKPLAVDNKYDLAICLEVVEHLPESAADNMVSILTDSSDVILFSAAIPGQEGQFHLNEQWPGYWQKKFAVFDFVPIDNLKHVFWENPNVEWWYKQNMLLYIRKKALKTLSLEASDKITIYIHPDQFNLTVQNLTNARKHTDYLEKIINSEITKPKFIPSFKRLVKSIIKINA